MLNNIINTLIGEILLIEERSGLGINQMVWLEQKSFAGMKDVLKRFIETEQEVADPRDTTLSTSNAGMTLLKQHYFIG